MATSDSMAAAISRKGFPRNPATPLSIARIKFTAMPMKVDLIPLREGCLSIAAFTAEPIDTKAGIYSFAPDNGQ